MGVSVLIQSVTRNDITGLGGVTITKALRSTPTATIKIIDPSGAYLPAVGNLVEVQEDGGIVLFGGSIEEVERIRRNSNIAILESNCTCVGKADRLNQRLAGSYEWANKAAGVIVEDLIYNSLQGDITDTSLVAGGPSIDSFTVDYPTVQEALQAVCNLTGYEYYVQPDGKLAFFSPSSNAAPFSITTGANVIKLTTRETREDFCNSARAKVAESLRDPETQTFTGDGSTQSFTLDYAVAEAPTVFVGGVANTVGIFGVDTAKDWYWSNGSSEIRQEPGDTPISGATDIAVTYIGIQSIIVASDNTASISARAAAESNSGIYQKLIQITQRVSTKDAQAIVDAYVDRHSELSTVLLIETDMRLEPSVLQIEPGQLLSVSLTGWHAAGTYLVRRVSLQLRLNDQSNSRWTAQIEAISGPILRNYIDVFRDITGNGSVSGSATLSGGTSGAGTYVYEPAKLTANTTIVAPVAATQGAAMVIYIIQGAGPYLISFDPDTFGTIANNNIGPVEDSLSVFPFVGRSDGKWWPSGFPMTDL